MVADSIWHIAKAPALEVLEHTAAQQAIGGRSDRRRVSSRVAGGKAVANHCDQLRVVQRVAASCAAISVQFFLLI